MGIRNLLFYREQDRVISETLGRNQINNSKIICKCIERDHFLKSQGQ